MDREKKKKKKTKFHYADGTHISSQRNNGISTTIPFESSITFNIDHRRFGSSKEYIALFSWQQKKKKKKREKVYERTKNVMVGSIKIAIARWKRTFWKIQSEMVSCSAVTMREIFLALMTSVVDQFSFNFWFFVIRCCQAQTNSNEVICVAFFFFRQREQFD